MRTLLVLGLGCAITSACGPSVSTVAVEPAKATLVAKDQKVTLKAVPKDKDGKDVVEAILRLKWASSNPAVATVAANGIVTAVKSGDAKITASVGDVVGSSDVVVSIPASITFDPPKTEIVGVKKSVTITPIVKDETGRAVEGAQVVWSTSSINVAGIADGLVTAEGAGTAEIKATAGEASGVATIVVTIPPIAALAIEPATQTFEKAGEAARLKVNATDAEGQPILGVTATWKSSDDKVATVTETGQVQAVKKGKAKITATAGDKSASAEIVVK